MTKTTIPASKSREMPQETRMIQSVISIEIIIIIIIMCIILDECMYTKPVQQVYVYANIYTFENSNITLCIIIYIYIYIYSRYIPYISIQSVSYPQGYVIRHTVFDNEIRMC